MTHITSLSPLSCTFFPSLIHLLSSPGNEWKLSLSSLLLLGCSWECWVSRKDGVKYPTAASVVNWQPLPWLAALQQDRKSASTGLLVQIMDQKSFWNVELFSIHAERSCISTDGCSFAKFKGKRKIKVNTFKSLLQNKPSSIISLVRLSAG